MTPSPTNVRTFDRPPRTWGPVGVNNTRTFGSLTQSSETPGPAPCQSDGESSSHWVGAWSFHTEPTLQTAALVRQTVPCSATFARHTCWPKVTQHSWLPRLSVHSLLLRPVRFATRRRRHRGPTHSPLQSPPTQRPQLLTTLPGPVRTQLLQKRAQERHDTTSIQLTSGSGISLTIRDFIYRMFADFLFRPTLETRLRSFLSLRIFIPQVSVRYSQSFARIRMTGVQPHLLHPRRKRQRSQTGPLQQM